MANQPPRAFHQLSRFVQLSVTPIKEYEDGPDYDILDPRAEDEVNALADKVAIIYLASFEPPSLQKDDRSFECGKRP